MLRFGVSSIALLALVVSACGHAPPPPAASPDDLIPVGAPAPDFIARAHDGTNVHLSDLRGHDVVLYFYPKDDTTGCTKEACSFRDSWERLQAAGVVVLGVSTQDSVSHTAFATKYKLPFPLLPDPQGEIAGKYHVPLANGLARRVTYLIDKEGRVAHVWPRVNPEGHAGEIFAALPPA
ncbi:MAG TPA: redoxin domain-containing protein [Polyangia bacterium]|nr:redoxin domain-containing protein [Polyangia bacterium]